MLTCSTISIGIKLVMYVYMDSSWSIQLQYYCQELSVRALILSVCNEDIKHIGVLDVNIYLYI